MAEVLVRSSSGYNFVLIINASVYSFNVWIYFYVYTVILHM